MTLSSYLHTRLLPIWKLQDLNRMLLFIDQWKFQHKIYIQLLMYYINVLLKSKMAACLETPRFELYVTIYRPVEIPNDLIRHITLDI